METDSPSCVSFLFNVLIPSFKQSDLENFVLDPPSVLSVVFFLLCLKSLICPLFESGEIFPGHVSDLPAAI